MVTRITQSMMNNTFLRNLSFNNARMEKYQRQIATGKQIELPEDDPVVAGRSMYYRANQVETNKYLDNASEAQLWMRNTEGALMDAIETFQRLRELAVQASNDTLSLQSRQAIAAEVDQLRNHLNQLANTSVAGRYIFGGTNTLSPPSNDGVWSGNGEKISFEIGEKVTVAINIVGAQVFDFPVGGVAGTNMFTMLKQFSTDLNAGVTGAGLNGYIGKLDEQSDNVLAHLADLGARTNRLELTKARLESLNINLEEARGKAEDIDMADAITKLKGEENVLRAALSIGGRILQPNLSDFLR